MKRRHFLQTTSMGALLACSPSPALAPSLKRKIAQTYDYDVVVCGGGTAGMPAAVAAARQGAKVALIEKGGYIGGIPGYCLMPTWYGISKHHSGLLTEFANRVEEFGVKPNPWKDNSHIDPEVTKFIFMDMALKAGVNLHLHSFVMDVDRKSDHLKGVVTASKSGIQLYLAKSIVDSTGDGDVAYMSDAKFELGDHGEMQAMTLRFRIGHVDMDPFFKWAATKPLYFPGNPGTVERKYAQYQKGEAFVLNAAGVENMWKNVDNPDLPRDSHMAWSFHVPGEISINATRLFHHDGTITEHLTKAEITCRKQLWAMWRYLRDHVPGFANSRIIDTGDRIGVRESRLIQGDITLTYQDCKAEKNFEDSVMTSRLAYDLHEKNYSIETQQGLVDVPYGCFLPKGIDGLLIAGRCLSTDHITNSSIRKMETAFQSGQVAGTAAALAAKNGTTPRNLAVTDVQAALKADNFMVSQKQRLAEGRHPFKKL
jgi:hypothetical protein